MHDTDTDIEAHPPTYTHCSALRITPYADGTPNHNRAVVYQFTEPVTIAHVSRYRMAGPGEDVRVTGWEPLPGLLLSALPRQVAGLVALIAPYDHPQPEDLATLARFLRWHRDTPAAVEAWSETPVGAWLYMLYPRLQHTAPTAWTAREHPGTRTHVVGEVHATQGPYHWPNTSPAPHVHDGVRDGVRLLQTLTATPPPPITRSDLPSGTPRPTG